MASVNISLQSGTLNRKESYVNNMELNNRSVLYSHYIQGSENVPSKGSAR